MNRAIFYRPICTPIRCSQNSWNTKLFHRPISLLFFSSAWLCQQSSCMVWAFVHCLSSVCRLSVLQLSRNLLSRFLSDFSISVLGCPGAEPGWKWTLLKKKAFCDFLWIFQFFANIRPYGSKNFTTLNSSFKSLWNYFNLFFWIFFWVVLTKVLF